MRLESSGFAFVPVAVSRTFLEIVLFYYPRLKEGENAEQYRRMMQYVLLSSFTDEETGDRVAPYTAIAALVGVKPEARGFRAKDWLDNFSRDVVPLNPSDHRYVSSKARTIRPEFHPDVLAALSEESRIESHPTKEIVWFHTGDPVAPPAVRKVITDHEIHLREITRATIDESHPAHDLVTHLLERPQGKVSRILEQNLKFVQRELEAMPGDSDRERRRREWCEGLVISLRTFSRLYYSGSERTPRIFAIGPNMHQLPRDLRSLAFAGCVECDLKSAQFAVVVRIWDIPELQAFLKSGRSLWAELADEIAMPIKACKPILKRTVYSIIFGMTRRHVREQLAEGTDRDDGIGDENADLVLQHPILRRLLTARDKATARIRAERGAVDAWGRRIVMDDSRGARSVLSEVVQSYEMKLMLSALDVIKKESQIYLVSWLHDGITVALGNKPKARYQIVRLQRAVAQEAARLGIETALEAKLLPIPVESGCRFCRGAESAGEGAESAASIRQI